MSSPDQTSNPDQNPSFRISIVDANKNRFSKLTELLESQNLRVSFHVGSTTDTGFIKELAASIPDIVIINLFLDGKSTLARIKAIKAVIPAAKIIVLTAHNSTNNIRESVKSGADDFILDPFEPQLMLDRIRYQLQDREMFNPESLNSADESLSDPLKAAVSQKNVDLIYEALRSLSEITDHHEALTTVLEAIATNAESNRVNLIEGDLETSRGLVAASSDDSSLMDLEIDLERYPEVREVLLNGNIIYIKDITQNPLTKDIQKQVKSITITSLLVFPIRHRSNTLGSLNIRLSNDGSVSERQLKTYFIIALALGPKLAAKKLLRKHKLAKDFASIASSPETTTAPEATAAPEIETAPPAPEVEAAPEAAADFSEEAVNVTEEEVVAPPAEDATEETIAGNTEEVSAEATSSESELDALLASAEKEASEESAEETGTLEEQLEKEAEKSDGEMSLEEALREAEAQMNSGDTEAEDLGKKEPEISAAAADDEKKEVTIEDLLQSVEEENS